MSYIPGRPAGQPERRANGADRERVAGGRAVRDLQAIAVSQEEDGVVADDVAAAHRLQADFAAPSAGRRRRGARSGPAVSSWRPVAAATASARVRAVPDGASRLARWWVSTISMSYAGAQRAGRFRHQARMTLMPTE